MEMIIIKFIVLFFVAWFIQNIIHEGSHIIFGFQEGRSPMIFRPWPGYFLLPNKKKKWFFAIHTTTLPTKWDSFGWYWFAPAFVSFVELLIVLTIIYFTRSLYVVPFIVVALGDNIFFWHGYARGSKYCDGQMWRNKSARLNLLIKTK